MPIESLRNRCEKMDTESVRLYYLALSEQGGPIETVNFFEAVEELSDFYLNYALACVCEYPAISMHFVAGLRPYEVRVGQGWDDMKSWSPSSDPSVAGKLIQRFLGSVDGDEPRASLLQIVKANLGEQVELLKPSVIRP